MIDLLRSLNQILKRCSTTDTGHQDTDVPIPDECRSGQKMRSGEVVESPLP